MGYHIHVIQTKNKIIIIIYVLSKMYVCAKDSEIGEHAILVYAYIVYSIKNAC